MDPPSSSPRSLFSATQRAVLAAIADTVLGDVSDPATRAEIVARRSAEPHLRSQGVTAADLERYLATKGSSIPGLLDALESTFQRHVPADTAWQIGLLLSAMGTTAGNFALSGHMAPFQNLGARAREDVLHGFANSMLGDKRKVFGALKQLICVKAFGTGPTNQLWKPLGFEGPRPSEEAAADAEAQGRPEPDLRPHMLDLGAFETDAGAHDDAGRTGKKKREEGGADYIIPRGTFDAVVVGSGCGGSVVAERLTARGFRVLVVEKGRYLSRSELHGSEDEFDRLYERGGNLAAEDSGLVVLAGSAFGGGSAVNWACCLEPPHYVREEWSKKHGLPHFVSPAFQRSLDRVTERLRVVGGRYGGELKQNRANNILIDGCRRLGMHVRVAPNNMVQGGDEMGEVGVGDRHGYKQSTLETYLWDAARTGRVKFLGGCEARHVLHQDSSRGGAGGSKRAVRGVVCNVQVGSGDGRTATPTTKRLIVYCPVVIVSCGSINSPALLMRSEQRSGGIKSLNESGMVGKNLRLHPVVGLVGTMPDAVDIWKGAPMTTVSEVVAHGRKGDHYGAKLEVPAILPGYCAGLLPWENAAQFKDLVLDVRRMFAFIVLCRDKGDTGSVWLDKTTGHARVNYPLETHDRESMLDGLVKCVRIAAAAGATKVGSSIFGMGVRELPTVDVGDDGIPVDPGQEEERAEVVEEIIAEIKAHGITTDFRTLLFSAHQMGTCRMGANPSKSVVGPTGEAWGCHNLFVCDASVFPTSSGVNPMLTTMAIADGIAEHVVNRVRAAAVDSARL